MSENCPKCGINKGELAGYGKDRRPIYYPHDPGDIQCRLNQKDAQLAALTQRAEQAEAWQNRAIDSAKEIATVECIDGVWWAKCRYGGLYGPQATEREVWLEAAEMRLTAAEAEVRRLREEVDDARIYITTEDGSKLHIRNLIRCGLRSLRKKRGVFWGSVADAFGIGSTSAHRLCRFVNLDPDTGELAKEATDAQ